MAVWAHTEQQRRDFAGAAIPAAGSRGVAHAYPKETVLRWSWEIPVLTKMYFHGRAACRKRLCSLRANVTKAMNGIALFA